MRRLLYVITLAATVGAASPSLGMKADAAGSLDFAGGSPIRWSGTFELTAQGLSGRAKFDFPQRSVSSDVTGFFDSDRGLVTLASLDDIDLPGYFEGTIDGRVMSGSYRLANGSAVATWSGLWEAELGQGLSPAPSLDVRPFHAPEYVRMNLDVTDPMASCAYLQNPGAVYAMSDGAAMALGKYCLDQLARKTLPHKLYVPPLLSKVWQFLNLPKPAFGLVVGISVQVNDTSMDTSVQLQNEPTIAVSSLSENTMVAAFNDGAPGVGYATSSNGGASWVDRGAPPSWASDAFDPVLANVSAPIADKGIFFLARNSLSNGRIVIMVSRSGDTTGQTFPVVVNASQTPAGSSADKPALETDPVTGYVYVCWHQFGPSGLQIFFTRSTNGGLSYAPPHPTDRGGHAKSIWHNTRLLDRGIRI